MLNNLSPSLLNDLNSAGQNFLIDVIEQTGLTSVNKTLIPSNIILEPSGKAMLKIDNEKVRINSIYEVMPLLQDVIDMASKTMAPSWLNNERLIIQRPVINVESETPAIVFKVLDGKPGAAGTGAVNAPSRRMVAPILKGRYIDPQDDSSEVYIYSQRIDYNISLSVYGKTAHEADILKEWVMDIIKVYLWYVKYSGVVDFTFTEETGDDVESLRHKRTVKYAVSIEKLNWSSLFVIKDVVLKLSFS
jgi:hypothetical protein